MPKIRALMVNPKPMVTMRPPGTLRISTWSPWRAWDKLAHYMSTKAILAIEEEAEEPEPEPPRPVVVLTKVKDPKAYKYPALVALKKAECENCRCVAISGHWDHAAYVEDLEMDVAIQMLLDRPLQLKFMAYLEESGDDVESLRKYLDELELEWEDIDSDLDE